MPDMGPRPLLALVFVSTVLLSGNMTMLSVTAPVISADLGATPSATSWMVLGYLMVTATLSVAMGQVSDLWDARKMFGVGLGGFAAASGLLVTVQGPWSFVGVRTVQGLFSAIILATAATLLVRSFPGPRLTGAMGIYLGGFAAAQVVAPPVGGMVADSVGWRWMFVGSAVLAGAACLAAPGILRAVPDSARTKGGFDLLGNLTLVVGVGALLLGVTSAQQQGWTSSTVVALLLVALACAPTFVVVESRVSSPVVEVGLLRDRTFALAVAAGGLVAIPRVVPTVVLAVMLQGRHGMSATQASGIVLALAVGVLLGSLVAGRMTTLHGVDRMCRLSSLVSVGGVAGLMIAVAVLGPTTVGGLVVAVAALVLVGLATGLFTAANGAQILTAVPPTRTGSVNAVRTTAQSIAIAVGTAALLTLLGGGLEPTDAQSFFSGDRDSLGPAALAVLDVNVVATLGALLATAVAAAVLTHLMPPRDV